MCIIKYAVSTSTLITYLIRGIIGVFKYPLKEKPCQVYAFNKFKLNNFTETPESSLIYKHGATKVK